ncbi:hypothetical protein ACTXT7_016236 [Hymenolepis weldensis]
MSVARVQPPRDYVGTVPPVYTTPPIGDYMKLLTPYMQWGGDTHTCLSIAGSVTSLSSPLSIHFHRVSGKTRAYHQRGSTTILSEANPNSSHTLIVDVITLTKSSTRMRSPLPQWQLSSSRARDFS